MTLTVQKNDIGMLCDFTRDKVKNSAKNQKVHFDFLNFEIKFKIFTLSLVKILNLISKFKKSK
jgi:hypothetical protein